MCKKTRIVAALIAVLLLAAGPGRSQIINEATKKKIGIGVGLMTDIWMNMPKDVKTRTINQGFQIFATYNVFFGKSRFGFGIGLGFSAQNLYGNFLVDSRPDSTSFVKISDTLDYNRSKITFPYLWLPIEFRFVAKSKFVIAAGFRLGYMLPAHTKYVGEDYIGNDNIHYTGDKLRVKFRDVNNLEKIAYGPTLRIGYKWIHLYGYYSLSTVFIKNKGPEIYPISVGFLLRPF